MPEPTFNMKKRNFNLKAHKEWRQKLIDRDKGCIICGATKLICAHHLIPECKLFSRYATDVDNGVMLCPTHHIWGIYSAHKHPFWFANWMMENRPEQYYLAVRRIGDPDDL